MISDAGNSVSLRLGYWLFEMEEAKCISMLVGKRPAVKGAGGQCGKESGVRGGSGAEEMGEDWELCRLRVWSYRDTGAHVQAHLLE